MMRTSVRHRQTLHGVAGRSLGEQESSHAVAGYPIGLALVAGGIVMVAFITLLLVPSLRLLAAIFLTYAVIVLVVLSQAVRRA